MFSKVLFYKVPCETDVATRLEELVEMCVHGKVPVHWHCITLKYPVIFWPDLTVTDISTHHQNMFF